MIAGQAGETQWVKHGAQTTSGMMTQGPPLVNDPLPFWGSPLDTTQRNREPSGNPRETSFLPAIASNLTFATLPLTFAGTGVEAVTDQDVRRDPHVPFALPFLLWRDRESGLACPYRGIVDQDRLLAIHEDLSSSCHRAAREAIVYAGTWHPIRS